MKNKYFYKDYYYTDENEILYLANGWNGVWQRFIRNPNLKLHNLVKLMFTAI